MRLIDADKLDDELIKLFEKSNSLLETVYLKRAMEMVDNQPTVNEWIPCSEKLPDSYTVICCDEYENIMIGHVFEDEGSDTGYSAENDVELMDSVVAWKELPEPYKVGSKARKNFFNTLVEEK